MVVLKGIPRIISPDLLNVLARMGHGDEIVLADVFFPTGSICKHGPEEIRADGHGIPELLEAIMKLFPLDAYVDKPAHVMDLVESDKQKNLKTPVWDKYQEILNKAEKREVNIGEIERFAFYDRAKTAFAVVHTGESSQYGNLILKKGLC
ncbi:fucose mutarotase-like [Saccoglossus kowalevskii]|uniref:L-fucose mutarotase n=1 Tax=Saccoglossus kowalevskii TaxID=10224 RepID=A0ABM0GZ34_SACKO|nr:PREDICTED: fucose mutarotase-like [Saccoglossus kowalevskii]